MKIYYAAPLHDPEDRERNAAHVRELRVEGYTVYLPQEHGVWEDLVKANVANGMPEEQAVQEVRKAIYKWDLSAMQRADCCVAYAGNRPPSEGMLWEMGYMTGANKPVYLYSPHGWRYNLMPEFGSTLVFTEFDKLLAHLAEEDFR